jgi:hypothetical protein
MGMDMSGGTWHLFVRDPQGNAAQAAGDLEEARRAFEEVAVDDASQAPEYLYRAARPALWARDGTQARRLALMHAQSGGFGPITAARRATIGAGIAALDGRKTDALALYREALRNWKTAGAQWDEALTGVDMAELLDPSDPEVADAIRTSRSILERLRAKPYLARLDAAVAAGGAAPAERSGLRSTAGAEVAVAE